VQPLCSRRAVFSPRGFCPFDTHSIVSPMSRFNIDVTRVYEINQTKYDLLKREEMCECKICCTDAGINDERLLLPNGRRRKNGFGHLHVNFDCMMLTIISST